MTAGLSATSAQPLAQLVSPLTTKPGKGCQAQAAFQAATAPQRGWIGSQRPCGVWAIAWGRSPAPPGQRPGQGGKSRRPWRPAARFGGHVLPPKTDFPLAPASKRTRGRGIEPWRAPRHAATGTPSRRGQGARGGLLVPATAGAKTVDVFLVTRSYTKMEHKSGLHSHHRR